MLPARPLSLFPGGDAPGLSRSALSGLVPFEKSAAVPGDTDGEALPENYFQTFRRAERRRCADLKALASRFEAADVIHFIVGFMPEDYARLAFSEQMRRHCVRMAVRRLLRAVEEDHAADRVDSLVAMHLESAIPHVHVALSRHANIGVALKRINTLPAALLPLN